MGGLMDILTIIIALGLIWLAWKILMGLIRIGVVVLILFGSYLILSNALPGLSA